MLITPPKINIEPENDGLVQMIFQAAPYFPGEPAVFFKLPGVVYSGKKMFQDLITKNLVGKKHQSLTSNTIEICNKEAWLNWFRFHQPWLLETTFNKFLMTIPRIQIFSELLKPLFSFTWKHWNRFHLGCCEPLAFYAFVKEDSPIPQNVALDRCGFLHGGFWVWKFTWKNLAILPQVSISPHVRDCYRWMSPLKNH